MADAVRPERIDDVQKVPVIARLDESRSLLGDIFSKIVHLVGVLVLRAFLFTRHGLRDGQLRDDTMELVSWNFYTLRFIMKGLR